MCIYLSIWVDYNEFIATGPWEPWFISGKSSPFLALIQVSELFWFTWINKPLGCLIGKVPLNVSNHDYWANTPLIFFKPWFINPELTLIIMALHTVRHQAKDQGATKWYWQRKHHWSTLKYPGWPNGTNLQVMWKINIFWSWPTWRTMWGPLAISWFIIPSNYVYN